MSENVKAPEMTNVIGYFNPHKHPIYLEISDLNLKCTLPEGMYIKDRQGNYLNDPVFEVYAHSKGLCRATSEVPVPINYVARLVQTARPIHSVTAANAFVRQSDGTTLPAYTKPPTTTAAAVPMNKSSVMGMSVEKARQLGLIGKARLVPEDYGVTDTVGAPPSGKELPGIKVSMESTPRVRTAAPMTPEMMEADAEISIQERMQRNAVVRTMSSAAASHTPDVFDPSKVTVKIGGAPQVPMAPAAPVPQHRVLPRVVAEAVEEPGMIQDIGDGGMPDPVLETPAVNSTNPEDSDKRYVCAADGKPFRFRSELDRYVKRKFPSQADALMAAYPPEK